MSTPTLSNESAGLSNTTNGSGSRSTTDAGGPSLTRTHTSPLEERPSRVIPPPQSLPARCIANTVPTRDRVILSKFSLYETKARYYIVGCDEAESHFRVLKLDRTLVYMGKGAATHANTTTSTNAAATAATAGTPSIPNSTASTIVNMVLPNSGMPSNSARTVYHMESGGAPVGTASMSSSASIASSSTLVDTRTSYTGNATMISNGVNAPYQTTNMVANAAKATTTTTTVPASQSTDQPDYDSSSSSSEYNQGYNRSTMEEPPVVEVAAVYSREECENLLATIRVGNKASGGMHKIMDFYGVIGFVRFTEGYYMVLITRRRPVATLGGHFIYHIEDTALLSIRGVSKLERKTEESRYVSIFQSVDLNQNFYFSYAYDLTNTLQRNMSRDPMEPPRYNSMFMWNHYLVASAFPGLVSDWVLPVVHGFVDQRCLEMLGHDLYLTLVARRSRHFAGTRFLKRGANDRGYVANDVETEQIVHDTRFTSMHQPARIANGNPGYTAYVQHRGSIPLNWSQDTSNMARKPPIHLNVVDPYYSAAARHFDNMFARYGTPIIVLNLVKKREKTRREVILLDEFTEAVNYLNQFLPKGKIQYIAWDMSRAFKSEKEDVISMLEKIGEDALKETGFFHSGREPHINKIRREIYGTGEPLHGTDAPNQLQHGVVRTNCIDCIDRTNAAQFVIGKCAFAHQLYALGIVENPTVEFDSDAVDALTELYHDHGNTIALQYGGSNLVNTTQTYRKMNPWSNQSRDMLEAIKRYYSNSFVDAEKQGAINLFLGNYIPHHGGPPLWELLSDHHLHNMDPRIRRPRHSYIHWYSDKHMKEQPKYKEPPKMDTQPTELSIATPFININEEDLADDVYRRYWLEFYPAYDLVSLTKLFTFNMKNTHEKETDEYSSPFKARINDGSNSTTVGLNIGGFKRWLTLSNKNTKPIQSSSEVESLSGGAVESTEPTSPEPKPLPPVSTMEGMVARLLQPQVSEQEEHEYGRYVDQFRTTSMLLKPVPHNGSIQDPTILKHPEYRTYANYVGRTYTRPHELRTSHNDEQIYNTYVKLPHELMEHGFDTEREESQSARQRREAYQRWLKTGKFRGKHPLAKSLATTNKSVSVQHSDGTTTTSVSVSASASTVSTAIATPNDMTSTSSDYGSQAVTFTSIQ